MGLICINPPTAEPFDLAEAKLQVREDVGLVDEDSLLRAFIATARNYAEDFTHKQFCAASYKQVLDAFPFAQAYGGVYGVAHARPGNALYLERGPVLQVTSIQYLDQSRVVQTLDPTLYVVDYSSDPVKITPIFGQIWPIPMPQIGSVWINFLCGYAAPLIADATANTIRIQNWPALAVNDIIRVSNSGGALPGGLAVGTDYFIKSVVSSGVYTLAASIGGTTIDLTDIGTGTSYVGIIPENLVGWMRIRFGALTENREEVAILSRGKIEPLPYVDQMLIMHKTWQF
jgi:uncharacterized phiE125 gp8 family phage protein